MASSAVTANWKSPAVVGVPESVPPFAIGVKTNPGGRLPLNVNVNGAVPPSAVKFCAGYRTPTCPAGIPPGLMVMVGHCGKVTDTVVVQVETFP